MGWSSSGTGPLPDQVLAASGIDQHCLGSTPCKVGTRGGKDGAWEEWYHGAREEWYWGCRSRRKQPSSKLEIQDLGCSTGPSQGQPARRVPVCGRGDALSPFSSSGAPALRWEPRNHRGGGGRGRGGGAGRGGRGSPLQGSDTRVELWPLERVKLL